MVNVNDNCSTGSSALWVARQAVESGAADIVLALGSHWDDRSASFERFNDSVVKLQG